MLVLKFPDGSVKRETSKTDDPKEAKRYAQLRVQTEQRILNDNIKNSNKKILSRIGTFTVSEAVNLYLKKIERKDSITAAISNSHHIKRLLGKKICESLRYGHIEDYISERRNEKATDSTINREISVLGSSLKNAIKRKKIKNKLLLKQIELNSQKPDVKIRTEFPDWSEIKMILKNCPPYLRRVAFAAYRLAWRKDELLDARFKWIRSNENRIRIPVTKASKLTKKPKPRLTPLSDEMIAFFKYMKREAQRDLGKSNVQNEYIFRGRSGKTKITHGEFYRYWNKALIESELLNDEGKPAYVFHTLRKSAVKFLRSKRIPDTIICRNFTGHLDFETFQKHYDIESIHDEDLARKLLNR
jgi:integrase